jgi:LysM repeat protein
MRRTTRTVRLALASLAVTCASSTVALIALPELASASPAPATASSYTVRQDDTLFGIARRLGVRLDALLAANGLTATSMIHPGMVLQVPAGASGSTSGAAPTGTAAPAAAPATGAPAGTYVIQAGDSISGIAAKHGLKYGALLKANRITIDSVLVPGRTLVIPAGGTTPAPAAAPSNPPAAAPAGAAPTGAPATSYVVRPGDSLVAIAGRHGLKIGPLMKANGLRTDSVLLPGRTLTIPAGGTPAAPVAPASPAATGPDAMTDPVQARISTVVAFAQAQLGKPWAFATAGPDTFDCSGLTRSAYLQIGISLPHSSVLQANRGVAVDWYSQDIQAGDLIFMATTDAPGVIGHVGIAIDSRRWIHSPRAGDVVRQGFIPADARLLAVRRYVTG